jgi:hypothetical protein
MGQKPYGADWRTEEVPEVVPQQFEVADDATFKVDEAAKFVMSLTGTPQSVGHGSDGIGLAFDDCC